MYDKEILQIVIACTLLFGVFGFFFVLFIIRYKNRLQQHKLEKQRLVFELENKELALGFSERELILDEVSQEIHDNIGQIAHLIRMNLYTIEQLSEHKEQLELIKYICELTDRLIKESRHISNSLNSDFIKNRGLFNMLEYDLERINATKQISCFIDIDGDNHNITAEAQLLVYRIAQEAIHNVLQHANATNLEMKVAFQKDGFIMIIRDDGIGFDETVAEGKGTMGIGNMYQRAKLINGSLNIRTGPGKGCCITLTI